jgi:hypothetical protein
VFHGKDSHHFPVAVESPDFGFNQAGNPKSLAAENLNEWYASTPKRNSTILRFWLTSNSVHRIDAKGIGEPVQRLGVSLL